METELLGTPSVVLTTRPFVSQARAMSRMRGNPDYGLAIIDHPIVILTHDELLAVSYTHQTLPTNREV